MDVVEIRSRIKEIIANITNIDAAEIGDTASFVEDLQLDARACAICHAGNDSGTPGSVPTETVDWVEELAPGDALRGNALRHLQHLQPRKGKIRIECLLRHRAPLPAKRPAA